MLKDFDIWTSVTAHGDSTPSSPVNSACSIFCIVTFLASVKFNERT